MVIRRRCLWLVALGVLMLAGGAWLWAVRSALSTKDISRITDGMTRSQVIEALGRPPDATDKSSHTVPRPVDCWLATDGLIVVPYDENDLVEGPSARTQGFIYWQWQVVRFKIGL
jgi:hypothetical protein